MRVARFARDDPHERFGAAYGQVVERVAVGRRLGERVVDERGAKTRAPVGAVVGGAQGSVLGAGARRGEHAGVAVLAHEGRLGLRAEDDGHVDASVYELLEQHEQGCCPHPAADEERAFRALGHVPARADGPDELGRDLVGGRKLRHAVRAESHDLVEDLDRAARGVGLVHRERAAQDMALHPRDAHVHELAGADRLRDFRCLEHHEMKPRAHLVVLENRRRFIHKVRHVIPPTGADPAAR